MAPQPAQDLPAAECTAGLAARKTLGRRVPGMELPAAEGCQAWTLHTHPPTHPTRAPLPVQLKGYAAAKGVRGTVFLETIGINADDLTTDIIVNDCYYLGLVGVPGGALLGVRGQGRVYEDVDQELHSTRCALLGRPGAAAACAGPLTALCPPGPAALGGLLTGLRERDPPVLGLQALLAFALLYFVMPRPRWAGAAARKP